MEELPFSLYKYHKRMTKASWRKIGLKTDNFDEIYNKYIYATHCDLCGKEFMKSINRNMDHCHNTGEFRNIVCRKCNGRKYDVKINKNNTSGYRHISKQKDSHCKQGFHWEFKVFIDGKSKILKSSIDLDKLVEFRDKWFKENPEYFT
jgi:hypothetical protein